MYLVPLLTLFQEATQAVYDDEFPEEDFRALWVSLDYPAEEANYPGIWINYMPTSPLQVASIGHRNYTDPAADGSVRAFTKWRFGGTVAFTIVAFTSFERYRLVDSLVEVLAFGKDNPTLSEFQATLDRNDLIGLQMQWDQFSIGAPDESQGTPWGTDDILYEMTVSVDCQGEFASDALGATLIPLTAVTVTDYAPGEGPADLGQASTDVPAATDWQ